jgi:hypothetical protein
MVATFVSAFAGTLAALVPVLLVIIGAGLLVRRNIVTHAHVEALSRTTVILFLPCLMFSKILKTLDPGALPLWWLLPIAGVAMVGLGLVLAVAVFGRSSRRRGDMLALASMQNAGYLVLPVGLALYPSRFDDFALYCFLFLLGFNPVLWSVGKMLISGRGRGGWRGLVTPPLVACLAGVAGALAGLEDVVPRTLLAAIDLIGQAAVPVATVVLGAVLGGVHLRLRPAVGDGLRVMAVKFVLLPAAVVGVLYVTGIAASQPLLARFLVLEAASAPAAGLVLMVSTYGGDHERVGSVMLLAYVACVITIPGWLAVWELLAT